MLPMIAMMMNVAQLPVRMPMTMAAGQMTPLATASQSVLPVVPGGAESGRGAGVLLSYVGAHVAGCAYGWSGEPGCGDFLAIFIKVTDNRISDISFLVDGCVAAVASSSVATELAKGKTLEEASMITDGEIVEALDGLPEHKLHCSVLGATALKNAVEHYYKRNRGISRGD